MPSLGLALTGILSWRGSLRKVLLDISIAQPYDLAMTEADRGRWAFTLASAAVLWGFALVPVAFLVPVYGSTSSSAGDPSGTTLVAVNGASPRLLVVVALPAVLAMLAWLALHRLCSRGASRARSVATLAIVSLAGLTVLTGFTIGIEMLPALVLLVIARRLTPSGVPG